MSSVRSWGRSVIVFVVVTAVLAPAIYWIAVTVSPPRTDGHGVMPLGQVALAILGSPIGGALAAWRLGRRRVTPQL